MPKNKIVGKSKKPNSNKATGRKYGPSDLASNRRNQEKRVELNREARKRGIYGKRSKMDNGKGKDLSHGRDGSLKLEKVHSNRRRNGASGASTLR